MPQHEAAVKHNWIAGFIGFWISIGVYLLVGDYQSLFWIQNPEYQKTTQQYSHIRWVVYQVQKQTLITQIQVTEDPENSELWAKLYKLFILQGKSELAENARIRAQALDKNNKN